MSGSATSWTVACHALPSWNFSGKNTGVGCRSLLQGIFLTPGWNSSLCITDKFFNVYSTKNDFRSFLCLNLFNHYTHYGKVTLLSLLYRVSLIAQLVKNPTSMQDLSLIPGSGRSAGERIGYPLQYSWVSLVAHLVKNPPAIQETWVQSLFREHSLEWIKATTPVFLLGEFHGLVCWVTKSQAWLNDFHFFVIENHGVCKQLIKNSESYPDPVPP